MLPRGISPMTASSSERWPAARAAPRRHRTGSSSTRLRTLGESVPRARPSIWSWPIPRPLAHRDPRLFRERSRQFFLDLRRRPRPIAWRSSARMRLGPARRRAGSAPARAEAPWDSCRAASHRRDRCSPGPVGRERPPSRPESHHRGAAPGCDRARSSRRRPRPSRGSSGRWRSSSTICGRPSSGPSRPVESDSVGSATVAWADGSCDRATCRCRPATS